MMMKPTLQLALPLLLSLLLPHSILGLDVYMEFVGLPELLDAAQITSIEELVGLSYNQDGILTGSSSGPVKSITSVSIDSNSFADKLTTFDGTPQPFTLLAQVECAGCEEDGLLFSTKLGRSFFAYDSQYGINAQVFRFRFNDLLANADTAASLPAVSSFTAIAQIEQIADCPLGTDDTLLSTTIILNFAGNLTEVDNAQLTVLEVGMLNAYNFLNTISLTDRCDPLYRRAVSVNLTIPELDNDEPEDGRRRELQGNRPGGLNLPGRRPATFFFTFFFTCPFCPTDAPLVTNDASRRRRRLAVEQEEAVLQQVLRASSILQEDEEEPQESSVHRMTQITNPSDDDCICPVQVTNLSPPAREELVSTFTQFVSVAQTVGAITFIAVLDDEVVEVEQVDCPAGFVETLQDVEVDFLGNPELLTAEDLATLETAFVGAYNDLANNGCDPLFRILTDATILSVRVVITDERRELGEEELLVHDEHGRRLRAPGLNLPGQKPYKVNVRTKGQCKRCPLGTPNFTNDGDRLRHLQEDVAVDAATGEMTSTSLHLNPDHRFLQVLTDVQCFCDVEPEIRDAPTLEAFVPVYDDILVNQLEIEGVAAVTDAVNTENPPIDEAYLRNLLVGVLPSSALDDPGAARQAFQFLLDDPFSGRLSEEKLIQRFSVSTFWYAVADQDNCPEADIRGWNQAGVDTCNWGGNDLECNSDGLVNRIDLGFESLCGTIPDELFLLTSLEFLHLANNLFVGTIPEGFANLVKLESLFLNNNDFVGGIPSFIGDNLVNLQILRLSENEQLGGPIPASFGNLVNLVELSMTRCGLTGSLDAALGNIGASLQLLLLHENDLTGLIPASFEQFVNLQRMLLFENNLDAESVVPENLCEIDAVDIRVDRPAITCSCCQCCFPQ